MVKRLLALVRLGWCPPRLRIPLLLVAGVAVGLALALGHISRAPSYLSDAPETCMNCHVMTGAYLSWNHSAHREVATCTDCHVPHDSLASKYLFKAEDGAIHSTVFTLRREPEVIQLSQRAVPVVEANCKRCHEHTVHRIAARTHADGDLRCWHCHRETPHGRVQSLSAIPNVMQPTLPPILSDPRTLTIGGRAPRAASTATIP